MCIRDSHNGTKKQPVIEWEIEKSFLTPYTECLVKPKRVTHTVRKDNTICWKSNYYSLPLGTYKGSGSVVIVNVKDDDLTVCDPEGIEICRHLVSNGKGQTIKKTDHARDKKPAIDQMVDQLCLLLDNPLQGRQFLNAIREARPRYIRDQILILKHTIEKHGQAVIEQALDFCCKNRISSATDFKAVVEQYARPVNAHLEPAKDIKKRIRAAQLPRSSDLDTYDHSLDNGLKTVRLNQLRELNWLDQIYNIILLGPSGTGKTFLAAGLCADAVHKGYKAYFRTMEE